MKDIFFFNYIEVNIYVILVFNIYLAIFKFKILHQPKFKNGKLDKKITFLMVKISNKI